LPHGWTGKFSKDPEGWFLLIATGPGGIQLAAGSYNKTRCLEMVTNTIKELLEANQNGRKHQNSMV
jgi:hypothetical protein